MLTPARLLWGVVLLGAWLRLYRLDALSLWLDEGITVHYVRYPWADVLGLHGAYETHPPLYFVLVKLATLVLPEVQAGRAVSLVAGVLTIPVVYALAARLVNHWAGLLAGLVLAVSPLHVWFSQEARMYTLGTLFVALSYLALVAFHQSRRVGWAALYGVVVLLSLYASYSSIYALLPQALLFLYVTAAHRLKAWPLWAAAGVAVLGYLPWVPQLLGTMGQWGQSRAAYLGVTPPRVAISLLSVTGTGGNALTSQVTNGGYFWGSELTPWDFGLAAQALVLSALAAVIIVGAVALAQRARLALFVAALLLITIAVTALMSLLSPGFAERTVLVAVLGWAILAAGVIRARPRWLRVAGVAGLVLVLALSVVTLWSIYQGAFKQEWRALAADVAVAHKSDRLLVTYPTLSQTLIGIYQPQVFDRHVRIDDGGTLPPQVQPGPGQVDAFWFAYMEVLDSRSLREQIEALGYEQRLHKYYPHPLYLDLYARPGVSVESELLMGDR